MRAECLFLGALLVIGARITASFLSPGWTKAVLESLLPMTGSLLLGGLLHGRGLMTARRLAAVPVLAIVLGTIFEVERRWGWWAAGPLVVLTFLLIYQTMRSGILAPAAKPHRAREAPTL